jgi:mono/diheme cytochrome c family protein
MVLMKKIQALMIAVAIAIGASGCYVKHAQPYYVYAPDMHYGPGLKAQKEGSMRPPVKGTISRNFRPYELTTMDQAKNHLNPLPASHDVYKKGQQLFNVYCIVCHGKYGEGDGTVTSLPNWPRPLFVRPPSLQSDKIRDYKDGQIYHIITLGQSIMPSYAEKLNEEERWSIVRYLRVLYRAKHPTSEDMKKAENYVEDIGE